VFQGQIQNVKFPAPYGGMDGTVDNNPQYAKYLQNMLITDNNTCTLRYGTRLVAEFPFDENRIFRSQIAVMSHLGEGGKSEKIIYQNYLQAIPYIDVKQHVEVEEVPNVANTSKISIDITSLDEEQKTFIKDRIFDEVYLYIRQESLSEGAEITDVTIEENSISFNVLFPKSFFDIQVPPLPEENNFEIWWERGALYKLEGNAFNTNPLKEDLDPNVVVSHINYQGKLLIANGVNPVFVYDGNNITELKGDAAVLVSGSIRQTGNQLSFEVPEFFRSEIAKYIVVGSTVELKSRESSKKIQVTNITELDPGTGNIQVTLTLAEEPPANTRTILYKKNAPPFNFLAVANDRLWALAEGRSYKNKFRPPNLAMKAYYASDRKSVDGWFNQKTNEIEFIDLSSNSSVPDNLETIIAFQGKVLFLGRETTQIWQGEDPTVIDDGQNIQLPDFKWEMTVPVGIIQKSLFTEIPNDFVFLSKYGIMSLSSINQYKQLSVSYNFSNGINQHLNSQLEFVETNRDYRDLKAFLYPYGRFLGFKLKYNCLIYQLKQNGGWSIFSENFADSRSIYYDSVSQDLFLGMDNGLLLAYADKTSTQSYKEYNKGDMIWRIHYSWIYPNTTWHNESIFIACRTLSPIDINVQIYTDYNDSDNLSEVIKIDQEGGLYDNSEFGITKYSYRNGNFPYEISRFAADAIMLTLNGRASNQFIFDKLFLTGGLADGN